MSPARSEYDGRSSSHRSDYATIAERQAGSYRRDDSATKSAIRSSTMSLIAWTFGAKRGRPSRLADPRCARGRPRLCQPEVHRGLAGRAWRNPENAPPSCLRMRLLSSPPHRGGNGCCRRCVRLGGIESSYDVKVDALPSGSRRSTADSYECLRKDLRSSHRRAASSPRERPARRASVNQSWTVSVPFASASVWSTSPPALGCMRPSRRLRR